MDRSKIRHWAVIEESAEASRRPNESRVDALARYLQTDEGRRHWQAYLVAPAPGPDDLAPDAPGRMVPLTGHVWGFVPDPLPPPRLQIDDVTLQLVSHAEAALGELAGTCRDLARANPYALRPLRRRSAVFASGVPRAKQPALLLEPSPACGLDDEPEGAHRLATYGDVLHRGLGALWRQRVGVPLLLEIMAGLAPDDSGAGRLRQIQAHINEPAEPSLERARYIGPPPDEVPAALADLDRFMHLDHRLPLLLKLPLIHYQLGAIHPFVEGNGRGARIVELLLLREWGYLDEPVLTLAEHLIEIRRVYADSLLRVSFQAGWTQWVEHYLGSMIKGARSDARRGRQLLALWEASRDRLRDDGGDLAAAALVDYAFGHPIVHVEDVQQTLRSDADTARSAALRLTNLGIFKSLSDEPRIAATIAADQRPPAFVTDSWVAPDIVAILLRESP